MARRKTVSEAFRERFLEEQTLALREPDRIEEVLESTLTVENGWNVFHAAYPEIPFEEAREMLTAQGLMYIAVAQRIPEGVKPSKLKYIIDAETGVDFFIPGGRRNSRFSAELDSLIGMYSQAMKMGYDDFVSEGKFIYASLVDETFEELVDRQFKGASEKFLSQLSADKDKGVQGEIRKIHRMAKSRGISGGRVMAALERIDGIKGLPEFFDAFEAATSDKMNIDRKKVLELLESPDRFRPSRNSAMIFAEGGIIEYSRDLDSFIFHQYSAEGMKKVGALVKEYRDVNPLGLSEGSAEKLRLLTHDMEDALHRIVPRKARELPDSGLSAIEKKAFELERKYGVAISCIRPDPHKSFVMPTFKVEELEIIGRLLGIVAGLSGNYITEIYKAYDPKDYDGTPETAIKIAQKQARWYANPRFPDVPAGTKPAVREREHTKHMKRMEGFDYGIDECVLYALSRNFDGFMKVQLARIGRLLFGQLPLEKREEYTSLVVPDIADQKKAAQVFGFSPADSGGPLAEQDFNGAMIEYHLARYEQRPCALPENRKAFFDILFRPRLKE